jgi:hypothetical protein
VLNVDLGQFNPLRPADADVERAKASRNVGSRAPRAGLPAARSPLKRPSGHAQLDLILWQIEPPADVVDLPQVLNGVARHSSSSSARPTTLRRSEPLIR